MVDDGPEKFITDFDYEYTLRAMAEAYRPYSLWDESGRFSPTANYDILTALHTVYLTKAINDLRAETDRSGRVMIALTVALLLLTVVMVIPILAGSTLIVSGSVAVLIGLTLAMLGVALSIRASMPRSDPRRLYRDR